MNITYIIEDVNITSNEFIGKINFNIGTNRCWIVFGLYSTSNNILQIDIGDRKFKKEQFIALLNNPFDYIELHNDENNNSIELYNHSDHILLTCIYCGYFGFDIVIKDKKTFVESFCKTIDDIFNDCNNLLQNQQLCTGN
jgi:hypothetical protein